MDTDTNKRLCEIFSERKTIVHISKVDGSFYNGIILEVGSDFFVIKDRLEGKEYFVLFSELNREVEPYKERGE